MDYITTFERVEMKYVLTAAQQEEFMKRIEDHVRPNAYPHSDITSIYFDSDSYKLIRNSLDKPEYKEKLRLRCYGNINNDSNVFFEAKKKYHGITYKRRQDMTYRQAKDYILFDRLPCNTQIMNELDYLKNGNEPLEPKVLINYQRDSYDGIGEQDLRITFDYDVKFSLNNLVLSNRNFEYDLTGPDIRILEIKTIYAMPLWLTKILDEMHIYPGNFSKYGNIYRNYIQKEERKCYQVYSTQSIPAHSQLQII